MNYGILASYRDKFTLLKEKHLTDEEFIFYEYAIHLADFDDKHIGKFGTFPRLTNEKLGDGLGWKIDKTGRNFKSLIKKGFLKMRNDDRVEVIGFDRYIPKNAFKQKKIAPYLQEVTAEVRSEYAKMLSKNEDLRNTRLTSATKSSVISDIGSYKVNTLLLRSSEEYEAIVKELRFTGTDASDLEWIDRDMAARKLWNSNRQTK